MGQRHAANARALDHHAVVFDTDTARGWDAEVWFHPAYFDAVMICTPASAHAEVARWLLHKLYTGPLFVEKPLDLVSDAEVFRLWPHPVTMVGYNMRWHPGPAGLRVALDALPGRAPLAASFWTRSDRATWKGASYADALAECSHELDLAVWLLGPVLIVDAESQAAGGRWTLELTHRSGARSRVVLSNVDDYYSRGAVIETSSATFSYHWDGTLIGEIHAHYRGSHHRSYYRADIEQTYRAELSEFLAAVREGRASAVPFADGLAVTAVIDHARRLAAA